MKKIISIFLITILFTLSVRCVSADMITDIKSESFTYVSEYYARNSEDTYVDDSAGLLSEDEKRSLNEKLKQLSLKYGIDFVIHTTDSVGGKTSERYADDYYDNNGYGDDGLMLLMDMGNRYAYITTKGEAIDLLSDYGLNTILNDISSDLSGGKYYKAFSRFADKVEYMVVEGRKGNVIDVDNNDNKTKSRFGLGNLGISAFVGAISSLISTGIMKGKMKTVSRERYARNYVVDNSFVLTGASDMLVDKKVRRTIKSSSRDDGGNRNHGGGSTVHVSSSGSVHGGQGKHF